jgi:prepilin-type processing-associated H-X9-DG protein
MLRRAILCFTFCFLTCLGAGAQDRSTPEATVRTFLAAFGSGDMKTAAICVKGAQTDLTDINVLVQPINKELVVLGVSSLETKLDGNRATVTCQVSMKFARIGKTGNLATQLNLASSEGKWLIVPDVTKINQGTLGSFNTMAYMFTDTKPFLRAREAARGVSCLSNVKQIGLGVLMFIQDHDERYKFKAETYKKSIMPYIKNEAVFRCPDDKSVGISYSFNANLAGIGLANLQYPADTVMIYEGKNGKLDFRHNGKASVGFADGHAKLINAEGAKKLRWKP